MNNEELLAEVVKIFAPSYKEKAVNAAQDFMRVHAQIFGLSPDDNLAPIAQHLLLAAKNVVEPSLSENSLKTQEFYGKTELF